MTFKEIKEFADKLDMKVEVETMGQLRELTIHVPARIPGCRSFIVGHTFDEDVILTDNMLVYHTTELIRQLLDRMNGRQGK